MQETECDEKKLEIDQLHYDLATGRESWEREIAVLRADLTTALEEKQLCEDATAETKAYLGEVNASWSKLVESLKAEGSRTGAGNGEKQVWNIRQALDLAQGGGSDKGKGGVKAVAQGLLAGLGVARTAAAKGGRADASPGPQSAARQVAALEDQIDAMRQVFTDYSQERQEEVRDRCCPYMVITAL